MDAVREAVMNADEINSRSKLEKEEMIELVDLCISSNYF